MQLLQRACQIAVKLHVVGHAEGPDAVNYGVGHYQTGQHHIIYQSYCRKEHAFALLAVIQLAETGQQEGHASRHIGIPLSSWMSWCGCRH